jgi:hypothetical protein
MITTEGASIVLSIFPSSKDGLILFFASALWINVNLAGQQLPEVGANFSKS